MEGRICIEPPRTKKNCWGFPLPSKRAVSGLIWETKDQLYLIAPCRSSVGRQVSQGTMGGGHFAKDSGTVLLQEQAPILLSLCHCVSLSSPFLCCKMPCCSGQSPKTSNRCFYPKYKGAQTPAASPNEERKALIEDPIILYNKRGGELISAEWDRAISGDFKTVSSEKEMVSSLRHHEKKVIQHWPVFLILRAFYLYFFVDILLPSISHLAICLWVEWPDLQECWIIIKSTFCCESKQSPIKFYHAKSLIWNSCGLCKWDSVFKPLPTNIFPCL